MIWVAERTQVISRCIAPGCLSERWEAGMCRAHYQRMRSHGTFEKARRGKDYAGMRFGRLVAIADTGHLDKWRCSLWEFRCDCGAAVVRSARSMALAAQKGMSSGCDKCNTTALPFGRANTNSAIGSYKTNARRRGLEFSLSEDDLIGLFSGDCHYCGAPPRNVKRKAGLNGDFVYQGIDRIDNSLGYIPGNCVPCCEVCNWAKKDMPVGEFAAWVRRVSERLAANGN